MVQFHNKIVVVVDQLLVEGLDDYLHPLDAHQKASEVVEGEKEEALLAW